MARSRSAVARGLGMRGGHGGALQHLGDFRLGEGFGQDLPGFGRLDVDGGVVMDAAVEQEPVVKAAQAAELARGGAGIDGVGAKVFEKGGDILLRGGEQRAVALLKKLGEGLQVAVVGFAGERTQAFFYAKVDLIALKQLEIVVDPHRSDYLWGGIGLWFRESVTVPRSSRNQEQQHDS